MCEENVIILILSSILNGSRLLGIHLQLTGEDLIYLFVAVLVFQEMKVKVCSCITQTHKTHVKY
jgi:hypothetical protein